MRFFELSPSCIVRPAARDAAILSLHYGAGHRLSEALSLTGKDAPAPEALRVYGKGNMDEAKSEHDTAVLDDGGVHGIKVRWDLQTNGLGSVVTA